MTTQPPLDIPRGLKGRERVIALISHQRQWINWCENNGKSYTGENGRAIREADEAVLRGYENELAFWPPPRQ